MSRSPAQHETTELATVRGGFCARKGRKAYIPTTIRLPYVTDRGLTKSLSAVRVKVVFRT